jgi:hypothetical protein
MLDLYVGVPITYSKAHSGIPFEQSPLVLEIGDIE